MKEANTMTRLTCKASIVAALALLAGCAKHSDPRPILTKGVFFAAAKKCEAMDPKFTFYPNGKLPTVSFGQRSPATGECLAVALKNYQFGSMAIIVDPSHGP
jgi:hypothetical protein